MAAESPSCEEAASEGQGLPGGRRRCSPAGSGGTERGGTTGVGVGASREAGVVRRGVEGRGVVVSVEVCGNVEGGREQERRSAGREECEAQYLQEREQLVCQDPKKFQGGDANYDDADADGSTDGREG